MTKRKIILIIILSICFIIFVSLAIYGRIRLNKWKTFEGRLTILYESLSKYLNLTPNQREKLNNIKIEILNKRNETKTSRDEIKNNIIKLIRKDSFDKNEAQEIIEKIKYEREKYKDFLIQKVTEFHSLLTKEQRYKLADKIDELYIEFNK